MKANSKAKVSKPLEGEEDDFDFESDYEENENQGIFSFKSGRKTRHERPEEDEEEEPNDLGEEDEDDADENDNEAEEEEEGEVDLEDEEREDSDQVGDADIDKKSGSSSKKQNKKLKKLTAEELEKEQKRIKRTGVCYLSKIPPYMKPAKLRSVLSRFGTIDRLFLKPEDSTTYHKRVKYGGNKKKNFTEGWVEFVNKKDAKLCASTLNGNKLGGKKTSYYYDDIINIKYLSGFKWLDLTQQIAKENEIRQAKLALELSHQQKLNKSFISNVEKSKMISNIQKKRKNKADLNEGDDDSEEIRRNFKQRRVTSTRSDAREELKEKAKPDEKLNNILSKVF